MCALEIVVNSCRGPCLDLDVRCAHETLLRLSCSSADFALSLLANVRYSVNLFTVSDRTNSSTYSIRKLPNIGSLSSSKFTIPWSQNEKSNAAKVATVERNDLILVLAKSK